MNVLTFVAKYRDYYLPPEAEKIYNSANSLHKRIQEVAACLKIPYGTEGKEVAEKLKFTGSHMSSIKSHLLHLLEEELQSIANTLPSIGRHGKLVVQDIVQEGIDAIYNTNCALESDLQGLGEENLIKAVNRVLSALNPLRMSLEIEKVSTKRAWFSKALAAIKVSTVVVAQLAVGIVKTIRRHPQACIATSAFILYQKTCDYLAAQNYISDQYCPSAETSWNSAYHIPVMGLLLGAVTYSQCKSNFDCDNPRPNIGKLDSTVFPEDEKLDDVRLNLSKKNVKAVLKRCGREEMLVKLMQWNNGAADKSACCSSIDYGLEIRNNWYRLRVVKLRNKEDSTPSSDELSLLHELGHLLHKNQGNPFHLAGSLEAFLLRLCLPFPLPILFFGLGLKPFFATNPMESHLTEERHRHADRHQKFVNLCGLAIDTLLFYGLQKFAAPEMTNKLFFIDFFKKLISQSGLDFYLTRYKKMEEEMECDKFAMQHASSLTILSEGECYHKKLDSAEPCLTSIYSEERKMVLARLGVAAFTYISKTDIDNGFAVNLSYLGEFMVLFCDLVKNFEHTKIHPTNLRRAHEFYRGRVKRELSQGGAA